MIACECYRYATAASVLPFDPSQRAGFNEGFPDPGGPLPGELPLILVTL